MNELVKVEKLRFSWNKNSNGMTPSINGKDMTEILHHYEWASIKASSFYGRTDLINQAVNKILENINNKNNNKSNLFPSINLALIGKSGSGKTAAMSVIANEIFLYEQQKNNI